MMEHLLLKAATTAATDQGAFTAIAAAYSVDRVNDRIVPGAFKTTIGRWQQSGKLIPLHWNHEGDPKSIIGSIDPKSMRETDDGLYVEGKVDLGDSETAREAWRSMKNGSMSLSFGYIATKTRKASGDITELLDIDLFEVSIVPAPANADTRVLSLKAMGPGEMAAKMRAMADEMASDDPPDPADMARRMRQMADQMAGMGKALDDEKAVWTAAYINDLPDSAFLYVESGDKDSDGKTTPRSLRHFPYKDAGGTVDLPHLRNALARIPQSNLSQDVKDRLTAKAQRILDNSKTADVTGKEPKARPVDSLSKRQADDQRLHVLADGVPLKPPTNKVKQTERKPELALEDLKRRMRDEMLVHLSGDIE